MTKGQNKPKRDKKKPKQENSGAPKSAYAQSIAGKGAAQPLVKRK
jgi:hypothetical protein